jgi:hypothetical protein
MKNGMNFIKGVGTGMVAGIAVAASVKCLCDKNKKFCKRTGKAVRTMSGIMEDIQELLR